MSGLVSKIRLVVAAVVLAALLSPSGASAQLPIGETENYQPPPIRHVWVIVLENSSWSKTVQPVSPFNTPGVSPYLANVLTKQGNLLTQYWGIGHNSQDDYVAMVSGQAPTPGTQSDGILCAADALGGALGAPPPN